MIFHISVIRLPFTLRLKFSGKVANTTQVNITSFINPRREAQLQDGSLLSPQIWEYIEINFSHFWNWTMGQIAIDIESYWHLDVYLNHTSHLINAKKSLCWPKWLWKQQWLVVLTMLLWFDFKEYQHQVYVPDINEDISKSPIVHNHIDWMKHISNINKLFILLFVVRNQTYVLSTDK